MSEQFRNRIENHRFSSEKKTGNNQIGIYCHIATLTAVFYFVVSNAQDSRAIEKNKTHANFIFSFIKLKVIYFFRIYFNLISNNSNNNNDNFDYSFQIYGVAGIQQHPWLCVGCNNTKCVLFVCFAHRIEFIYDRRTRYLCVLFQFRYAQFLFSLNKKKKNSRELHTISDTKVKSMYNCGYCTRAILIDESMN